MEGILNLARQILEYCREFKAAGIIELIRDYISGLTGGTEE